MHDGPGNDEQPSEEAATEWPEGEPREEKLGRARRAARSSVLSDLADDVRTMTGLVSDLHYELEELTNQNARRWNNGKWALAAVVLLLMLNVSGLLFVRGLQDQLEAEVQRRVSSTCEAVEVSRQALSSLVDVIRSQSDIPIPDVEDPAMQEFLKRDRERSARLVEQMDEVTQQITCKGL